jgi:glyceraldehyde-3-phosphate dehydrogenase (NAD(P))
MAGSASRKTVVHIVGTGTIGEPLIGLCCDFKDELGLDEVFFHKRTPLIEDRPKVRDLIRRGARLVVDADMVDGFHALGLEPHITTHDEALEQATVVIDCTPVGNENKEQIYRRFEGKIKGFIAQGSEFGFGKMYARGVNDRALVPGGDQYIQVVSCNTHNIAVLLNSIAYKDGTDYDNLVEGKFVCMRRANDISQSEKYCPAPEVGVHDDEVFGTHHAHDAHHLFETLGVRPNIFSSSVKLNSQYMHAIWFDIRTKAPIEKAEVLRRFHHNDRISVTKKLAANEVFSFGRDHGHFGRILNQTVICEDTLTVKDGHEIVGFCYTPQDGNSLLSSIAATCWLIDPEGYEAKFQCLKPFFFDEV